MTDESYDQVPLPVWYVPTTLTPLFGWSVPDATHAMEVADVVAVVEAVSLDCSPVEALMMLRLRTGCSGGFT